MFVCLFFKVCIMCVSSCLLYVYPVLCHVMDCQLADCTLRDNSFPPVNIGPSKYLLLSRFSWILFMPFSLLCVNAMEGPEYTHMCVHTHTYKVYDLQLDLESLSHGSVLESFKALNLNRSLEFQTSNSSKRMRVEERLMSMHILSNSAATSCYTNALSIK